jgi:hypothetical protein
MEARTVFSIGGSVRKEKRSKSWYIEVQII